MASLTKLGICICLLGLTVIPWVRGSNLKAGVAKVDITPAPGKYMLGSGTTLATGANDPLYARVLVLEVDQTRLALITVDLCRVFQAPLMERLRQQVKESSGISFVLMVATHTHSAPIIPINENHPLTGMVAWQKDAVAKIEKAIGKAQRQAAEARLGTGYGVAYIGHNRRKLNPDGTVTMMFRNPTKIPTAPFDPTVAVLRIDTETRKPLAILVNYACHPVVVMANLKQYSADFPGVMCNTVEEAFGPQTMGFFLNGGAGDIDTYYTGVPLAEDPVARMEWSGETLGQEARSRGPEDPNRTVPRGESRFLGGLADLRFPVGRGKVHESLREECGTRTPRILSARDQAGKASSRHHRSRQQENCIHGDAGRALY